MKAKNSVLFAAVGGVIAALYAALTIFSSVFGIAFGPIQFRFSEALCVLPLFFPEAVPALALGCLVANLTSPYGLIDIIFGTAATLLAAITTRAARGIKIKGLPILSLLSPVVFNAVIVGLELSFFLPEKATLAAFLIAAAQVGVGELCVITLLGIPLYFALRLKLVDKIK